VPSPEFHARRDSLLDRSERRKERTQPEDNQATIITAQGSVIGEFLLKNSIAGPLGKKRRAKEAL
jgi:hypothetical protein